MLKESDELFFYSHVHILFGIIVKILDINEKLKNKEFTIKNNHGFIDNQRKLGLKVLGGPSAKRFNETVGTTTPIVQMQNNLTRKACKVFFVMYESHNADLLQNK